MTDLAAADQYHVGIVVDDLDAAKALLTATLGYEWAVDLPSTVTVTFPDGARDLDMCCVYSMTEPRLELIRAIPGTLWTPPPGAGTHHLGFWSHDVGRDRAALEDRGYQFEAAGTLPDGTAYWAYLTAPVGPRIELVSRMLQPTMEHYFEHGSPPAMPAASA